MRPPDWIAKELRTENPDLFLYWDERKGRWTVRMWTTSMRSSTCRDSVGRNSVLISTVCYRDGGGHDIGFKPLDSRIVYACRRSRWYGEGVGRAQMEIDSANEKLEKEFNDMLRDVAKDIAIDAHRHFDTIHTDLGSTRPYRYPTKDPMDEVEVISEKELIDMEGL